MNEILRATAEKRVNAEKPRKLETSNDIKGVVVPVILNDPLCLSCHGRAGSEITPSTIAALGEGKGKFFLLNKRLGDVLGFWIVRHKVKK